MDTYSVKQIADMLNTQPETVRRWIRSGKLHAEKASRKDGHVVTEGDLSKFLKSSPKYAGMACGLVGAAMMVPIAAAPIVGGIAATYLAAGKEPTQKSWHGNLSMKKQSRKNFMHRHTKRR